MKHSEAKIIAHEECNRTLVARKRHAAEGAQFRFHQVVLQALEESRRHRAKTFCFQFRGKTSRKTEAIAKGDGTRLDAGYLVNQSHHRFPIELLIGIERDLQRTLRNRAP